METSPDLQPVVLRVLVGSHAHGLARPDSDRDYREVFVMPTSVMLTLRETGLKFAWMSENKHTDDEGGHEIARWLHLVAKGAPNEVELCFAPLAEGFEEDPRLPASVVRSLGRAMISRKAYETGVIGYGMNGFKKIPTHEVKWKTSTLRVLMQGRQLIRTGDMAVHLEGLPGNDIDVLMRARQNKLTEGQVLDIANGIVADIKSGDSVLPAVPDYDSVNEQLLEIRKEFWS